MKVALHAVTFIPSSHKVKGQGHADVGLQVDMTAYVSSYSYIYLII